MNTSSELTINAEPTKEFFISMLVKDIQLIPAIIDLIDNSIDGARRLKQDGPYDGLSIRIEVNSERFRIVDNCGGIPVDVARRYVFRFGRASGMEMTPHSVGQFGVGMKRALFKMGSQFHISSASEDGSFEVKIDVEEWRKIAEWEFQFSSLEENVSADEAVEHGTSITISSLHDHIRKDFELDEFKNRLRIEIANKHQISLGRGLAITLNSIPVDIDVEGLLHSEQLVPAYKQLSYSGSNSSAVGAKIYAGISQSKPNEAGWNIFCNGRLVLGPDQSITTGWGENGGKTIPKFHNQFARFRGFVFFDSDDASALPWNTTKTSVDSESEIFRSVRLHMLALMRPVIDFLNLLDREKDTFGEERGPLAEALHEAMPIAVSDLKYETRFLAPKANPNSTGAQVRLVRIQYQKPQDIVDRVRNILKASSNRELGERTFDYFVEAEIDD